MAAKTSRPGRTLLVLLVVLGGMFGAVAAIGTWKPKLGLDLQGGERITLQARSTGGGGVTPDKLNQAVDIINRRVNGAGVAEAEVSTQGSNIIIIEIPGKPSENLAQQVGETAQLRFRLVAYEIGAAGATTQTTPTTPTDTTTTTGAPSTTPSTSGSTSGSTPTESSPTGSGSTGKATGGASSGASGGKHKPSSNNQVVQPWMLDDDTTSPTTPTDSGSTSGTTSTTGTTGTPTTPTDTAPSTGAPTEPVETVNPEPGGAPPGLVPPKLETIDDPYAWVGQFFQSQSPPPEWLNLLATYDCDHPTPGATGQIDVPDQPLLACDSDGNRYLLGPSMVDGTDVTSASAGIPQGGLEYAVDVNFNGDGAKKFGDVTTRIAQQGTDPLAGDQLAIVLDGEVISAPVNQQPIVGGQAQITGSSTNPFTQTQATALANSLKFGALPLTFDIVNQSTEGPELASNQLDAGIIAGIVGLLLVVAYCVLYYRGLSVVIISSLLIAGIATYGCVLLLAHAYGFTMTLPGIAGFIVAVGITADSFIVYFERLRDEVREGRTLRTSVETGWVRARTTILAADAISFLAALVLFIFAIGVVKGFAFALGLSTVIDVFVVFMFTKPMVTLLSRTKFFGNGHKWSGLDRRHLGMAPLPTRPRPTGGEA